MRKFRYSYSSVDRWDVDQYAYAFCNRPDGLKFGKLRPSYACQMPGTTGQQDELAPDTWAKGNINRRYTTLPRPHDNVILASTIA